MSENSKNDQNFNIGSTIATTLFFLIVIGVLFIFLKNEPEKKHQPVIIDGIIDTDQIDISSKLAGKIKNLSVNEGDYVKQGELLAVIESQELSAKKEQASAGLNAAIIQKSQGETALRLEKDKNRNQILQAKAAVDAITADIEMARNKLSALKAGARPQEKEQAKAAVNAAQSVYDTSIKTYNRIKALADDGVIAEQKADEALMAKNSAKAQLEMAKAKMSLAEEGSRKEEIAAAQAQLTELEARLSGAQSALSMAVSAQDTTLIKQADVNAAQQKIKAGQGALDEINAYIDQTQIKAPLSGRISKIMLRNGELAAPGYAIMSIAKTDKFWADVYIDESLFAGHRLGEEIPVRIPAIDRKISAKIIKVLPAADFATKKANNEKGSFDVRAILVRLELLENPPELVAGMTARICLKNKGAVK